jgi:hypothetical protein
MQPNTIDLFSIEDSFVHEELPEANALGCFATVTTASTASCPLTSASSLTTASSASG